MTVLVTGAAGFIGSHLCEGLLAAGHEVVGVDAFTANYHPRIKHANADALRGRKGFTLYEADLRTTPLEPLLRDVQVVFHLAGRPGVRDSIGPSFADYVEQNILVTHRLLEAAGHVKLLVFASSSSVYGTAPAPFREDGPVHPISPYGITKLAAESLCLQYAALKRAPAMAFRFFTVYGARGRPDMAFTPLARAILTGEPFPLFGTGEQTREFTEVTDIVRGLLLAIEKGRPGVLLNIGGGHTASMNHAIAVLEKLAGKKAHVDRRPVAAGDMPATQADTSRIRRELGFRPEVTLEEGLRRQLEWVRAHLALL